MTHKRTKQSLSREAASYGFFSFGLLFSFVRPSCGQSTCLKPPNSDSNRYYSNVRAALSLALGAFFVHANPLVLVKLSSGQNKRWIDETFAGASSVEDIVRKLEARARGVPGEQSGDQSGNRSSDASDDKDSSGREWAQETLKNLAKSSPTALKVSVSILL